MDLKSYFSNQLKGWAEMYARDYGHLSESAQTTPLMASARVPVDFTYEVAVVNRRIATRLRGEDPGPWSYEGWVVAPEEFRSQEAVLKELASSVEELTAAWEAVPEERIWQQQEGKEKESSPAEMVGMALAHMSYHDAQLNYLQELHGDMDVHWME